MSLVVKLNMCLYEDSVVDGIVELQSSFVVDSMTNTSLIQENKFRNYTFCQFSSGKYLPLLEIVFPMSLSVQILNTWCNS